MQRVLRAERAALLAKGVETVVERTHYCVTKSGGHERRRHLRLRVLRAGHGVPNGLVAGEDLVIVAPRVGLIPEKVNGCKPIRLEVTQAKRLVPARGEDVERDL